MSYARFMNHVARSVWMVSGLKQDTHYSTEGMLSSGLVVFIGFGQSDR